MNFRTLIVVFFCCAMAIGCEDLPVHYTIFDKPVADAVTPEGRGGYNWELIRKQGEFPIDRPPAFSFADKIDRVKIRQNLALANARLRLQPGPIPGMDADVYSWFRKLTEPITVAEPLMTVKPDANSAKRVYCISPNGKLLFAVDNKITVWEIETQKQRQFDAPIPNPIAIHANAANQSLVMCDDKKLCRFWFNGAKVDTWKLPQSEKVDGKIVKFVGARESGHCAVLNDQGVVYRLSPDFLSADSLSDETMSGNNIAISPDGNAVLGSESPITFEWGADGRGSMIQHSMQDFGGRLFQPIAGKFQRQWVSTNEVFIRPVATQRDRYSFNSSQERMRLFRPRIIASSNASDGANDWLVVLSEQKDGNGQLTANLRDVSFSLQISSQPYPLGPVTPKSISVSATGSRIAIEHADSTIKVIDRQSWVGYEEYFTMRSIAKLALEFRFDQAELCANTLRNAKLDREHKTGEVLFRRAAYEIGQAWERLAAPPDTPERKAALEKFEKWKEGGSPLAVLGYAYKQAEFKPRGDVSPNLPEFETTNLSVQEALLELASKPDAPSGALSLLIDVSMQLHSKFSIAEDLLARHIENHPEELDPLMLMSIWLLPNRDGMRGDAHATLTSIASLYPDEESDKVYAKIALLTTAKDRGYFDNNTTFDLDRIVRGGSLLIEQKLLSAELLEMLIDMQRFRLGVEEIRNLLKIHAGRFVMPSPYHYDSNFAPENELLEVYKEPL